MNILSSFHFGAVIVSLILGWAVYRTNPRRTTNQVFLMLSSASGLWLVSLGIGFMVSDPRTATWCIRTCHSMGATLPLLLDWLRLAIVHPDLNLRDMARKTPFWLTLTLAMMAFSQSPWIIQGAFIPAPTAMPASIPEPIQGDWFPLFPLFFFLSFAFMVLRYGMSLRQAAGMQRAELNFTLVGGVGSILTGSAIVLLLPVFSGNAQSTQFASLGVVVLDLVIAYGIATSRIMEMAYLFRLLTAYSLLTVYLGVLYVAIWAPVLLVLHQFGLPTSLVPNLVASIGVAFSLAPAHGFMQRFANRLFAHTAPLNIESVVQLTNRLLYSISTVEKLLADFTDTIARTLGTDKACVLLAESGAYVQKYPPAAPATTLSLRPDTVLPQILARSGEVIVPAVLRRLNPDPRLAAACKTIEDTGFSLAVGLRSKEGLEGILLLGPKLTGHIYGSPEQHALQLLCNHLAVALNNARLYTQLQDSKIYNDVLVDNLASGVIAADIDGVVTVFNREAQRITRQDPVDVLRHHATCLPPRLASMLKRTLDQGHGLRDQDLTLQWSADDETPIRASSSVFYGHTGKILGAFLVVNDLTAVKQLELQVRRTDRLASLGTLAAGMAHEIKNPLVSIKTFTQLLPERYEDPDFRETFFSLVGSEVKRIDRIVNQLLRFSRPAKPNLVPTRLHEVIDSALNLMGQQLRKNNIRLNRSFNAPDDSIRADGDQLSQALINFFLNAIEAMGEGGTLTVGTSSAHNGSFAATLRDDHSAPHVIVTIHDTGGGIPADSLPHIFDPFFTTKSQGTGLGLSVAHGIIHEHGGMIDVKSDPVQGTTFAIVFPLIQKESVP